MGKIITVKCNGPLHCINEVDLNYALRHTPVAKNPGFDAHGDADTLPERVVLPCRVCAPGRVVLLRETLKELLKDDKP